MWHELLKRLLKAVIWVVGLLLWSILWSFVFVNVLKLSEPYLSILCIALNIIYLWFAYDIVEKWIK